MLYDIEQGIDATDIKDAFATDIKDTIGTADISAGTEIFVSKV